MKHKLNQNNEILVVFYLRFIVFNKQKYFELDKILNRRGKCTNVDFHFFKNRFAKQFKVFESLLWHLLTMEISYTKRV